MSDLLATPAGSVDAKSVVLQSETATGYFQGACAKSWKRLALAEARTDREIACLALVALAYGYYVKGLRPSEVAFQHAQLAYQYAVDALGPNGKSYLDTALVGLDQALAQAPPSPTGLKALSALKKIDYHRPDVRAARADLRTAIAADLGALLVACKGFDYPGTGVAACFPWPIYPPEGDNMENTQLAPGLSVSALAACEYSPRVGNVRPDTAVHNCGQAAVPFWLAYLATGNEVYWNELVTLRDLLWAKGDGSEASADIIDFAGCYASWILEPNSSHTCSD